MKREAMTKKSWLNYFNQTMLDQGLISQQEYRRIKNKISTKYPSTFLAKTSQGGAIFLQKAEQFNKE